MRALVIGEREKALIAKLIRRAEAMTPIDAEKAVDNPYANFANSRFTIALPVGFTVTLTRERQPRGLFRHISVAVHGGKGDVLPSPAAVEMILSEFGMAPLQDSVAIWPEAVGDGLCAINVLQEARDGSKDGG